MRREADLAHEQWVARNFPEAYQRKMARQPRQAVLLSPLDFEPAAYATSPPPTDPEPEPSLWQRLFGRQDDAHGVPVL